MDLSFRVRDFL
ncbi:hypothetical protein HaLaN_17109 [Haematococcus lacustris]|uniref:Uncharacterized protein n=1 Tax=Haematococcus lacustris TaxID=44745 RepID=A0A699ZVT1_HAELA|nr:hypothetical protein HaLaN_17109 [Haematococcus lacustris]